MGRQKCLLLIVACLASVCSAEVSVVQDKQDKQIYRFVTPHFTAEVDAGAGARIRSFRAGPDKRELIALWKGGNEVGGALDDRLLFTAAPYDAAIMAPGPETAGLRLEARDTSGIAVVKIITTGGDGTDLKVSYQLSNGTQAPRRVMIRNFFLPGAQPQTDDHLYWVNGTPEREAQPTTETPGAHGYYQTADPAWAALWHRPTGDGIAVYAPGADRFYFWRGSKEFPTFEWLYKELEPGKVLIAEVLLKPILGEAKPDWPALLQPHLKQVRAARVVPLEGWRDEATLFGVTEAERQRGFWLTVGEDEGKQRLPDPLTVDLPAGQDRYLAVAVNVLKDQKAALKVTVPEPFREQVTVYRQTDSEIRRELLPVPAEPLALANGQKEVLWLKVGGAQPGAVDIPLTVTLGEATATVRLRRSVWPVKLDGRRPFHFRGYCGGWPVWSGHEVTEANLKRLEAILKVFADVGGDVIDWNAAWYNILPNVKLAATGELLVEVAKKEPERIKLEALPELDFSYFNPWFELARQYGVTRVETYMAYPDYSGWAARVFDPALGKGRVKPGTPEGERALVWFYSQMRKYLESQGCRDFFCKISDEISPEHIPPHIATAKVARQAGWRPFTTITGMIARTASHINAMNPYCDEWQLSFGLKDDFLKLLTTRYKLVDEVHDLPGAWGNYGNGGARDTVGKKVFGEGGCVPLTAAEVENLEVLEDGRPMKLDGGSPWGNQQRGVCFTGGSLKQYLWLSPTSGTAADHRYQIKVKLRREAADGEPLIKLDPSDEIWCYGGSSKPYRQAYHTGYNYPLVTLAQRFVGVGQWAFIHWNKTENIAWIGEDQQATVSPVYCGYRDGWHDAGLLDQLRREKGEAAFAAIVGEGEQAALKLAFRDNEVYHFRTIVNVSDPLAVNTARRRALQALSGRAEP